MKIILVFLFFGYFNICHAQNSASVTTQSIKGVIIYEFINLGYENYCLKTPRIYLDSLQGKVTVGEYVFFDNSFMNYYLIKSDSNLLESMGDPYNFFQDYQSESKKFNLSNTEFLNVTPFAPRVVCYDSKYIYRRVPGGENRFIAFYFEGVVNVYSNISYFDEQLEEQVKGKGCFFEKKEDWRTVIVLVEALKLSELGPVQLSNFQLKLNNSKVCIFSRE